LGVVGREPSDSKAAALGAGGDRGLEILDQSIHHP
jgi:hypothetical protein